MSWGKFLLTAVICVGGMQGAVITSGTASVSQSGPSGSAGSSGNFLLSDGVTVDSYHGSDGPLSGICYDHGQGCSYSGFPVVLLGNTSGFSDLIGAFLNVTFSTGYTAVPGVAIQTFQTPFTLTGSVYKYLYPNPSCPFPDAPAGSCTVPVTGSGIATSTITAIPYVGDPSVLGAFYLSSTTYAFTSPVPEPATPILITAGLGVLALMRKRRAA